MFEVICKAITAYVDVDRDTLTRDTDFINDLHMNSYDFVSLLGELEDSLGVEIPDTDIRELHTIGDVENYIKSQEK